MTEAERRAALEAVASEIRGCTRCRLHERRIQAVPGEGHPSTEVVFVGEGPGESEDRQGRPFVGRSGEVLEGLLASVGWRRDEVFITNVVKCRPPGNRTPEPDEVAACAPYLRRQLEILDPALVVALGSPALKRFAPGVAISGAHGTVRPADPATGARDASLVPMFHPAFYLRGGTTREAYEADMARIPAALEASRARRASGAAAVPSGSPGPSGTAAAPDPGGSAALEPDRRTASAVGADTAALDQMTTF